MNVSKLRMGNAQTLDSNIKDIKFEGDNSILFWRLDGEVCNAKAKLYVPETHWVIFIKNGKRTNYIEAGEYDIFDVKKGLFSTKKLNATVSIIFISKTGRLKGNWGLGNPIQMRDINVDVPILIQACGTYDIKVADYEVFYRDLVASDSTFTLESLKERLNGIIGIHVRDVCANYVSSHNVQYFQISNHILPISKLIEESLKEKFLEYGLAISNFVIELLDIPESQKSQIEEIYRKNKAKREFREDREEDFDFAEKVTKSKFGYYEKERELDSKDKKEVLETIKVVGSKPDSKTVGRFCPNCGAGYDPTMRFCTKCGYEFGGSKNKCISCHKEIESDAIFCPYCGTKNK